MFNNIIDETSVFQFQYYQVFYFFPFLYMLSKIYLVFKSIIFHYFLIQETETSKKNLCSYISGSNLQSLENEEISYILRMFSTSSLKSPSFLGESLGFFITFSSDVFISLCFHFFIFSFLLMILGVWLHLFTSLLLHCLSGTSLLCFCTTSATFLRKTERERKRETETETEWERQRAMIYWYTVSHMVFTFQSFLLLSRLPLDWQFRLEGCSAFHCVSKHTRSFCLFESHSVRQKLLLDRFYLCIRHCYRLSY